MASGFTQYMNNWYPPKCLFEKPIFKFHRDNDILGFESRPGFSGTEFLRTEIKKHGQASVHHIDKLNLMLQRPRVLKFDDMDFGVLENIEIKVTSDDYDQPFETVILELPQAYRIKNTVTDPVESGTMHPMFIASTWRKELKMLSLHIFLSNNHVYGCVIGNSDLDLDAQLEGTDHTFVKSLPILEEEQAVYNKILRACLNASLFATYVGLKCSPENPKYFEKLQKAQEGPGTESWRRFKMHPFIYTPIKSVIGEAGHCTRQVTSGWTMSPHWRKPHWRMQRCGKGLTETKRILISAVLVNGKDL